MASDMASGSVRDHSSLEDNSLEEEQLVAGSVDVETTAGKEDTDMKTQEEADQETTKKAVRNVEGEEDDKEEVKEGEDGEDAGQNGAVVR